MKQQKLGQISGVATLAATVAFVATAVAKVRKRIIDDIAAQSTEDALETPDDRVPETGEPNELESKPQVN